MPRLTNAMKQCRTWLAWHGLQYLNKHTTSVRKDLFRDGPEVLALCKTAAVDDDANKTDWKKQYAERLVACGVVAKDNDPTAGLTIYTVKDKILLNKIIAIPPNQGNQYLNALLFPADVGSIEKLLAAEAGQLNVDEDIPEEPSEEPEGFDNIESAIAKVETLVAKPAPVITSQPVKSPVIEEAAHSQGDWNKFRAMLCDEIRIELNPVMALLLQHSEAIQRLTDKLDASIAISNKTGQTLAALHSTVVSNLHADLRQLAENSKAISDLSVEALSKLSTKDD